MEAEVERLEAGLQAIWDRYDSIGRPGEGSDVPLTTLAAIAKQTLAAEAGEED